MKLLAGSCAQQKNGPGDGADAIFFFYRSRIRKKVVTVLITGKRAGDDKSEFL